MKGSGLRNLVGSIVAFTFGLGRATQRDLMGTPVQAPRNTNKSVPPRLLPRSLRSEGGLYRLRTNFIRAKSGNLSIDTERRLKAQNRRALRALRKDENNWRTAAGLERAHRCHVAYEEFRRSGLLGQFIRNLGVIRNYEDFRVHFDTVAA